VRTLAHLSDLHFGRTDAAVLEPLARSVGELRPDVVVISGDLTQRARSGQFEEARRFLDTLPGPQIIVPGNHDVPLYDVLQRFLAPLGKFRRIITADLEPAYLDEEIAVIGINTARSLAFKGGRVSEAQIEQVRRRLAGLGRRITRILVSHHPFDLPEGADARHIVGRARKAIHAFAGCGADLILSGHMHASHAGDAGARHGLEAGAPLVVQAGTATSTRGRGEANSFNAVYVEPGRARIDRHAWSPEKGEFALAASEQFERAGARWQLNRGLTPGLTPI
jgi:3',5'-cyclic AMP phosphodiesterase CpdA